MTNIDREALREAVANLMPLGYNETASDPADVFEAADRVLPLIADAVDAARAEGDKQGAARVREAVEKLMLARFPDDGEPVLSITMPVSALLAAITEAAPHD